MGSGSYDESEQQDRDVDASGNGAVSVHQNNYRGAVGFDANASTDELLDKLGEIKADDEDADER